MEKFIPFEPPLSYSLLRSDGVWGVVFAHGEQSRIDKGIIKELSKKLGKRGISTLLFNFPFRMNNQKRIDNLIVRDEAFAAAYNYAQTQMPDVKWAMGGHGIGGVTAIRASGIVMPDFGVPPILCVSYPMYPPNKPELVETSSLVAVMGEALFTQGDKSNRGTFSRLKNQIQMMAPHAKLQLIKGGNHFMEVEGRSISTIAHWIANDTEKLLKEA
ncbi:MAG: hypothetical protein IH840_05755 [Candidatus Heimdallarchaeota archaeon]|nr:hypothetical protein [Candidatus Heimdallarchaeota archaeon]